jgi:hypothetical protein
MACTSVPTWLSFKIVVGIAQSVGTAERQAEFFGQIGEKSLIVQVGLGLGNNRLNLIQLRQGKEDRSKISKGFVQPAGLRRIGQHQPPRLQGIKHGMARLVRDDIERSACKHGVVRRWECRIKEEELQCLLTPT